MHVDLVMFRDGSDRRPFRIHKQQTVIGRREDCDLRIAVGDVSRKHCRIVVEDDGEEIRVEDLGSSNGTFVNGHRVQKSDLKAGDTLQVGPVVFVVQVDGEPAITEMMPRTSHSVAGVLAHEEPTAKAPRRADDDDIGDIDELEILNDSGDSATGKIDLD